MVAFVMMGVLIFAIIILPIKAIFLMPNTPSHKHYPAFPLVPANVTIPKPPSKLPHFPDVPADAYTSHESTPKLPDVPASVLPIFTN